jgi:hypothetical protein
MTLGLTRMQRGLDGFLHRNDDCRTTGSWMDRQVNRRVEEWTDGRMGAHPSG